MSADAVARFFRQLAQDGALQEEVSSLLGRDRSELSELLAELVRLARDRGELMSERQLRQHVSTFPAPAPPGTDLQGILEILDSGSGRFFVTFDQSRRFFAESNDEGEGDSASAPRPP